MSDSEAMNEFTNETTWQAFDVADVIVYRSNGGFDWTAQFLGSDSAWNPWILLGQIARKPSLALSP